MRVLIALLLIALVAAEPVAKGEIGKIGDQLKKGAETLKKKLTERRPASSSTHKSSSSSSHSSSAGVDPAKLAKEITVVFRDADGSAFFKGARVLPETVAEVPPKNKKGSSSSSSSSSHHSTSSSHSSASAKKGLKAAFDDLKDKAKKALSSRHSGHSSTSSSASNPRFKRPLFNFRNVPAGVTAVGLRKHSFRSKHHALLVRFANTNAKVTTVIVVDHFVGPKGRPSANRHDTRKRGSRQSEVDVKGLRHKNLFVFDEKGKQLFPTKRGSSSSSSSKRHSSSSHHESEKKKSSVFAKTKDFLKKATKKE